MNPIIHSCDYVRLVTWKILNIKWFFSFYMKICTKYHYIFRFVRFLFFYHIYLGFMSDCASFTITNCLGVRCRLANVLILILEHINFSLSVYMYFAVQAHKYDFFCFVRIARVYSKIILCFFVHTTHLVFSLRFLFSSSLISYSRRCISFWIHCIELALQENIIGLKGENRIYLFFRLHECKGRRMKNKKKKKGFLSNNNNYYSVVFLKFNTLVNTLDFSFFHSFYLTPTFCFSFHLLYCFFF